jgi:hypothetical protein
MRPELSAILFFSAAALYLAPVAAQQPSGTSDVEGAANMASGDILIIGEVHGTNEIPSAFLKLVDHALAQSKQVSVGLEMPPSATLALCGNTGPEQELGQFWIRRVQDGRSSQAMRRLLCALKLRMSRGGLRLLYLGGAGSRDFQAETARRIAIEADAGQRVLALVGNFHSRNTPQSIAGILRGQGRKVTALTASAAYASAWNCTADGCGARPTKMDFCTAAASDAPTGGYLLSESIRDPRWDGCLVLGPVTSSPPLESMPAQ